MAGRRELEEMMGGLWQQNAIASKLEAYWEGGVNLLPDGGSLPPTTGAGQASDNMVFMDPSAEQLVRYDADTNAFITLTGAAGVTSATESAEGIAELATQSETDTGTDDERIVTPLKLEAATTVMHPPDSYSDGLIPVFNAAADQTRAGNVKINAIGDTYPFGGAAQDLGASGYEWDVGLIQSIQATDTPSFVSRYGSLPGLLTGTSTSTGTPTLKHGYSSSYPTLITAANLFTGNASALARAYNNGEGCAIIGTATASGASGQAILQLTKTARGTLIGGRAIASAASGFASVYSNAKGALAWGSVDQPGAGSSILKATGAGSFAHGAMEGDTTHLMDANGDGSTVIGICAGATSSNVVAAGEGGLAGGKAEGGDIYAAGDGALAWGHASSGETISASVSNAVQFGVGSNATEDSVAVGAGIKIMGLVATPGSPADGMIWQNGGHVYVRTNGITKNMSNI